jgi:hypothetical protein
LQQKVPATQVIRMGRDWKAGVYLLEIQQGQHRNIRKLIKQ